MKPPLDPLKNDFLSYAAIEKPRLKFPLLELWWFIYIKQGNLSPTMWPLSSIMTLELPIWLLSSSTTIGLPSDYSYSMCDPLVSTYFTFSIFWNLNITFHQNCGKTHVYVHALENHNLTIVIGGFIVMYQQKAPYSIVMSSTIDDKSLRCFIFTLQSVVI